MEEENYTSEFSTVPDIGAFLQRRLAMKKAEATAQVAPNGFDPHKLMVQKHKIETGEVPVDTTPAPQWPAEDVKALEDYCQKMGIVGFSTRQHPRLALQQLKQQMGDMSDIPLESRVPMGYEKSGTINSHNCNFPYSKPQDKKSLLNG